VSSGPRIYCTQFDSQYLARGIAMLRSLRRFDALAAIQVLALDPQCAHVLGEIFGSALNLITPETLRERCPALQSLQSQRSPWALYATQKPVSVLYALENAAPASIVAFVDADTWFFSDPAPMIAELGGASIGLSPHRYSEELRQAAVYGEFNAGCILWRADAEGLRCAADWARDCLDRCDERPDAEGRFMNQGYLSCWPERYSGVHILRHPGVNLAPWNVDNYSLAPDGAGVAVDGKPLIFFHFSGLVPDAGGVWRSFHAHRHRQLQFLRESIYGPYLAAVEAERRLLQQTYGCEGVGSVRDDLIVGPSVLGFRPWPGAAPVSPEVVRLEDAEVELEAHRRAIRGLVDAGMFEAALSALRAVGPPLRGPRQEWEYCLAFCLHSIGTEREEALRHYTAALELGYDEFWVCFHRGQLLLTIGRNEDGLRDLDRALDLRPEHSGLSDLVARSKYPSSDTLSVRPDE
jgi:tetratricopeptide (TPR) repeat protein